MMYHFVLMYKLVELLMLHTNEEVNYSNNVTRGDNIALVGVAASSLPSYISAPRRANVSYLSVSEREFEAKEYSHLDTNNNYVSDKSQGANQVNIWQQQVVLQLEFNSNGCCCYFLGSLF